MLDRRRAERFRLAVSLTVRDADTGEALGELVDISGHGLMVASDAPLALERRYRLRVELPERLGGELEVGADAAWSVRSLNPVCVKTGFSGLRARAGHGPRLERLIEDCYRPCGG